ncbi:helix-turn-helix transcriptional regulator [Sandaracinus amylolyticus]|uniref:helix-turn-helix transcriptional regulator n=1 Tax=Sandaracinus amylolyticus TaxID=927083 RepID=UPI001F1C206D|nr:helix-turn-helix transcriptional regulator [Sandaracinus amylolyticus]UJR84939.1 Hypothetical protein I5071_70180 [Sandaracinus amylolyticus]
MHRWPEQLLVWNAVGATAAHAHHAAHVVLATRGHVGAKVGRARVEGAGIWVPSNVAHAIERAEAPTVVLYVEPTSPIGAGLASVLGEEPASIAEDVRDVAVSGLGARDAGSPLAATQVLEALGVREGRAEIDARVARLLRWLEESELGKDEVALGALAARAGVSPTRLTHLFTSDVGTPLRRYVLWLRVRRALAALASTGDPIASIAARSGFADAAHLSRTMRSTFGMTPTQLLRAKAITPSA